MVTPHKRVFTFDQVFDKAQELGSGLVAKGNEYRGRCPNPDHEDVHPSFTLSEGAGGIGLFKCHSRCNQRTLCDVLGITPNDRRGMSLPPPTRRTAERSVAVKAEKPKDDAPQVIGCTLEQYAEYVGIPEDVLTSWGLIQHYKYGNPFVSIPYYLTSGEPNENAVRQRIALQGLRRFEWKKGSKATLYGLELQYTAVEKGYCYLVEGESDSHVLRYNNEPFLAVAGATNLNYDRDAEHFKRIEKIYVIREPDQGGDALVNKLFTAPFKDRVYVVTLGVNKDVRELWLNSGKDKITFSMALSQALETAKPLTQIEGELLDEDRKRYLEEAGDLPTKKNILEEFDKKVREATNIVGERRALALLYLSLTSRVMDKPVNVIIKGPSSVGKSFVLKCTLMFFPEEAYVWRTTVSARAILYTKEEFKHRHLIFAEARDAESTGSDFDLLVRSLLSEGSISHETVIDHEAVLLKKDGPTGLIMTTTKASLYADNETRCLSVWVSDVNDKILEVLLALNKDIPDVDISDFIALQHLISTLPSTEVNIPFGDEIVTNLSDVTELRLMRDWAQVQSLISAHVLVHHQTREYRNGKYVATLEDYRVVRDLVNDVIGQAVSVNVPQRIRETVKAVQELRDQVAGQDGVSNTDIRHHLKLSAGAVSDRVNKALEEGYLTNENTRRGRPNILKVGRAMPEDRDLFPSVQVVSDALEASNHSAF